LDRLCARLDRRVIAGSRRLGSVLRYVCRQTDNDFANLSRDELAEMYQGNDVDWEDAAALAAMRADQRAARAMADAYHALARRIHQRPARLARVVRAITAAARDLASAAATDPIEPPQGETRHDRDSGE
jgi:hypothetical protein